MHDTEKNRTPVKIKFINVDMFGVVGGAVCVSPVFRYSYVIVCCTDSRHPGAAKLTVQHTVQYLSVLFYNEDGVFILFFTLWTYRADIIITSFDIIFYVIHIIMSYPQKHFALSTCIITNSMLFGNWGILLWRPLSQSSLWCNWTPLFFHY